MLTYPINKLNKQQKTIEFKIILAVMLGAWNLTNFSLEKRAMNSKQVYNIKINIKGEYIKYKVRWVIKDFQ